MLIFVPFVCRAAACPENMCEGWLLFPYVLWTKYSNLPMLLGMRAALGCSSSPTHRFKLVLNVQVLLIFANIIKQIVFFVI